MATGITKLHSKGCPGKEGGRCRCGAGWEASVYSKRESKKIRKTFPTLAAAKGWRSEALSALERGALRSTKPTTVQQAWEAWYEGAKAATIRTRSGQPYKPSALHGYEKGMRLRVLPKLGGRKPADITLPELQDLVEGMISEGLAAPTIQVALLPMRAIYKRAIKRGELSINPCAGLDMPAITSKRDRFATATEAEALIAALAEDDKALWATALYAGLRRGELMGLRWDDVDVA